MRRILFALCSLLVAGAVDARIKPPPPPTIQDIAARYANYDIDGDGIREINAITLMGFEPTYPSGTGTAGLAVVLVDPRLLASPSPSMNAALLAHLQNHRDDLVRDGYKTRFFVADVYRGVQHQDGRTLLALRRFLKDVRAAAPLAGVTLIGSFPEATLFRRVLARTVENGQQHLVLHPERVNPRADIVLGDLDGNWEPLYQLVGNNEHLTMSVPNGIAFPYNGQFLSGTVVRIENVRWEDIFYLREDFVTREVAVNGPGDPVTVYIESNQQRNPELTAADRTQANPVARPEISVSRIDARGIAVNPTNWPDRFGRAPLDAQGRPQALEYDYPPPAFTWVHDPVLEQRIVADYLDRNHQHRLGVAAAGQYRTTAVQQKDSGLIAAWQFNDSLRRADPSGFGPSYGFEQATLLEYVNFLKTPGVLRGVAAHSNAYGSVFGAPSTAALLDEALGGRVWEWYRTNENGRWQLTPSARQIGGFAGWGFARTLWENRMLLYTGQGFYVHGGCSVNVPDDNYNNVSYDDDAYGFHNAADSVMFFQNGLGLLARGKVFYDLPSRAGESIAAAGGRFGASWAGMFNADGADATMTPGTNGDSRVYRNKKSYFWGLRGDWTVRLRY